MSRNAVNAAASLRARRKAAEEGFCTKCHKFRPAKGFRQCAECHDSLKRKRDARRAAGTCTECGKQPAAEGKVLCAQCRNRFANADKAKVRAKSRKRWGRLVRVTKAATGYVRALRELEVLTPEGNRIVCDNPDRYGAARMKVQSAVKVLFSAVEMRA